MRRIKKKTNTHSQQQEQKCIYYLSARKAVYDRPTINNTFNNTINSSEKTKLFPLRKKVRMPTLTDSAQHSTASSSQSNQQEKEIKGIQIERQRRQWHPTPVLLPGKSHGWRSLVGCSPWGRLSDFTFTFHFHALEKEMATHSSVLAWRIPGMGEPGGLPSVGWHRVGHD